MKHIFSLAIFAVLSTICISNGIPIKSSYDAQALDDEIKRIEELMINNNVYAAKPTEVCFQDIGCFSKVDGPFHFLAVLPESPETIGTAFYVYSRHNKKTPQKISYLDANSLTTSMFDGKKDTKVICHGFNEHSEKDWNLRMKDVLLEQDDVNVIMLDWGKGAILPYYGQAIVNSEVVGTELARLLELLSETRGMDIERVHILGFSLGAHLAGFTGKTLLKKLGKKPLRITGMDPAGPIFENRTADVHLSPADAHFVDIIHSSTGGNIFFGELGIEKPIGDVDFYPNGGKKQPDCGIFSLVCSHRRSVDLYTESMLSGNCTFKSYPCKNGYEAYKKGECLECGEGGCGSMGSRSYEFEGRGKLYLTTNDRAPFCPNA